MIQFPRRHVVTCLFIFLVTSLTAQDLQSLVNAEKAFAQTSVDKGIKAAFLGSFDQHTIAFRQGELIPGYKDWESQPEDTTTYLFWWPVFADIAASGDFGYTTGPAVLGGERTKPAPTGGMYYASVWKKNSNGVWKVVADLGSAVYKPAENLTTLKTSAVAPKAVNKPSHESRRTLLELDKSYNGDVNATKEPFDDGYFSDEARVHRPGIAPLTTPQAIKEYQPKGKYAFEHVDGQIASSNDMAITYGKVKITVNRDGKDVIIPFCYMRVWKMEGGEWNIVLDVVG